MWKMSRPEMILVAALALVAVGAGTYRVARRYRGGEIVAIGSSSAPSVRVDLNTAAWWELAWLPEIGETKARAIVAYREAHGAFARLGDLANVPGISDAMVERMAGKVVAAEPPTPQATAPR